MIEELERLARDCPSDWSAAADLASYVVGVEPSRYIAACSPDRVLRLLEVVKQAKAVMAYEVEGAPSWPEWDAKFAALRAALAGLEEGKTNG